MKRIFLLIALSAMPVFATNYWQSNMDSMGPWYQDGGSIPFTSVSSSTFYQGSGSIVMKFKTVGVGSGEYDTNLRNDSVNLDLSDGSNVLRFWVKGLVWDKQRVEGIWFTSSTGPGLAYITFTGFTAGDGWVEMVAKLSDLQYSNEEGNRAWTASELAHVSGLKFKIWVDAGNPASLSDLYIDDVRLTNDASTPAVIFADSMDNSTTTGWIDQTGYVLRQSTGNTAPNQTHQGNGCLQLPFHTNGIPAGQYDYAPSCIPAHLNLNQPDLAIRFWVKGVVWNNQRIERVYFHSAVPGTTSEAYVTLSNPYNCATEWKEVSALLSNLQYSGAVWTAEQLANVDAIKFNVWADAANPANLADIYIDDVRVTDDKSVVLWSENLDNVIGNGWRDNHHNYSGLKQAVGNVDPDRTLEGTGSLKMAFSSQGMDSYDYAPALGWLAPMNNLRINATPANKTAFRFWLYNQDQTNQRIEYIFMISPGKTTWSGIPVSQLSSVGQWKEYICKLSDMRKWVDGVGLSGPADIDCNMICGFYFKTWAYLAHPANVKDLFMDDLRVTTDNESHVPFEGTFQKADNATITVDGNPADWNGLISDVVDMNLMAIVPNEVASTGNNGGDLHVQYRFAWDTDYLYLLVQEIPGDDFQWECPSYSTFNDGLGSETTYDIVSFRIDLKNINDGLMATAGVGAPINWFLGLSSSNNTDLMMAYINKQWTGDVPAFHANGSVATSGTFGNRIIEAKLKWTDIQSTLNAEFLPVDGLVASIKPGFTFGVDPILQDCEGSWGPYDRNAGMAGFNGGNLFGPYVSGFDANSIDVVLSNECSIKTADLTGDCKVNLDDLAIMGQKWMTDYDWIDIEALAEQWLQ